MEGSLWHPATILDLILLIVVMACALCVFIGILGLAWSAFLGIRQGIEARRAPSDLAVRQRAEQVAILRYQGQPRAEELVNTFTSGTAFALHQKNRKP